MASRFELEPAFYGNAMLSGIGGSAITVPSWMRPGGRDVRGTTPYEQIQLNPGTTYRLVDFTGRNDNTVLAQGSSPEDLMRIQSIVNSQLVPKGRQADWRLERATGDGQFETIGGDLYNKSFLNNLATTALPIGLAILSGGTLAPAIGGALGVGSAVGTGIASGLGSLAGNLAVGKSLDQSLLSAGLTGLTAGGLSALGGAAPSPGTAPGFNIPIESIGGLGGGNIALPAFTAPSLSGLGGAIAGSVPGEIVVPAARYSITPALSGLAGGALATGVGAVAPEPGEMLVQAPRQTSNTDAPFAVPPIAEIPTIAPPPTVTQPANTPRTLTDWLQLGAGGLGVLSGLGGLLGIGGPGNAGAGIGAGFNPNPGLVSYQPLARTQNAPTFDPFTYGQAGGEFRFFNDAAPQFQINQPSQPAGIAPDPLRMARGGYVRGIGGGQDDLIDAKLSDGEYVISAQDVADLGDGSNEEGARRLDKMRKLIRKQAGRKNVKTIARPQKSVRSILEAVQ